ncbi:DNA cytosine methyltransferase [Phocaeicola faecalis]
MRKKYKVASLFSGCGGSDLGMLGNFNYLGKEYEALDYEIVFAVDFDAKAVETYNANFKHKAICADVSEVDFDKIGDVDVMIGGFPCQSFSTVNPTKDTNDARANLYKQIVRFLHTKKPKYFICENVKGLLTLQQGAIIQKIAKEFREEGYRIQYRLLKAVEYGIPQRRERVIIVGIRNDLDVNFEYPTIVNIESKAVPLNKVIDVLAIGDKKYYFSEKAVQGMKNAKNNMKRGLWQDLNGPCLTVTSHLAKVSLNSRDPVLLVNPETELYRRFTPREAARIQSFPDSFVFPVSESYAYKQIGNAIPPVFMWHIAKALQDAINGKNKKHEVNHYPSEPEEGEWSQLSLFEPNSLYISKRVPDLLIAQSRQSTRKWIVSHLLYNYPVSEEELALHPELLGIKRLIIMHRNTLVGYFNVLDCKVVNRSYLKELDYPVKGSTHKADTKYLLYSLEGNGEVIPMIDQGDLSLIMGKGTKQKK